MDTNLTPGTYRLAELEELFGRTRKTIERYIERFSLQKTEIEYSGRKVAAIILTQNSIDHIRSELGEYFDCDETKISNSNELQGSLITHLKQEKVDLVECLQVSQEQARRLEVENARLSVKIENHEQFLALKDEVIHSLKTSMVILERANKQFEMEKQMLEDKQKLAVSYALGSNSKPSGLWSRLKFAFGVG